MNGFAAFARKEVTEIFRTWRVWVLPGMLLFFAVSGPVLAKFTPEIVKLAGGKDLAAIAAALPKPTYLAAYAQWTKNLSQIVLFAVIIVYGGLVSAEVRTGTAALVLTKPLSRSAFVVAKASVHGVFLAVGVALSTLVTWVVTRAVFGTSPGAPLWRSAFAWVVLALLFLAVMTLLSVLLNSPAGAAGIGLGVYALLGLGNMSELLTRYSPAALVAAPSALAAGTHPYVFWPLVTSLALSVVLVALAAVAFRKKEL